MEKAYLCFFTLISFDMCKMSRHKVLTSKHQHFDTAQYLSFSSASQKISLLLLPPQPSPRLGSLPSVPEAWGGKTFIGT